MMRRFLVLLFSVVLLGCSSQAEQKVEDLGFVNDSLKTSVEEFQDTINVLKKENKDLKVQNESLQKLVADLDASNKDSLEEEEVLTLTPEEIGNSQLDEVGKSKPETKLTAESIEDEGIKRIRQYYTWLQSGELQKAYAVKVSENINFQTYSEWYGGVEQAQPRDFEILENGHYKFLVDYSDPEIKEALYQVVMEVVTGSKLKTISSVKVK